MLRGLLALRPCTFSPALFFFSRALFLPGFLAEMARICARLH